MRKIIVIIAVLLAFSGFHKPVYSQSDIAAVELSMTPFTDSEAWLSPGYFKARVFFGDLGARIGIGTGMLFSTDQEHQPETVKNLSFFDVRPGLEFYPVQVDRALPFIGIDFVFAMRNTNLDATVGAPITGAWDVDLDHRGYTALGFNIVVGGDYYLEGGGFFIGTEIGFEYLYFTHHEVKWGNELRAPETNSTQFRPTLRSSLRIGVAF